VLSNLGWSGESCCYQPFSEILEGFGAQDFRQRNRSHPSHISQLADVGTHAADRAYVHQSCQDILA